MKDTTHTLARREPTADLVDAARAGDEAAWAVIHGRYYALMRFVLHGRIPGHVHRRLDTDDVMQSGFLQAFQEIESYEDLGEDSFRRWLTALMFNKLRDKLRFHSALCRDSQRDGAQIESGNLPLSAQSVESPSVVLATAERIAAILAAIHALEPEEQRLLVLRLVDKLAWSQIADRLQIGETTARRHFLESFERLMGKLP